jgi:antitoxin (DNA-binding transcriptional repressor) of toxin-antitoxin stability system
MTIHVNIGEAKTRLSELIAASLRGEDVIIARDGTPQVQLVALESARVLSNEQIAAKRKAAFGKFARQFAGYDVSLDALKADRKDLDRKIIQADEPRS